MTEAWFSADAARSFAFFSLLAVVAVLEPVARKGRAKFAVTSLYGACIALGVAFVAAALIALLAGQPTYVMRSLLFTGFVITLPFTFGLRQIRRIYHEAELRKTVASDL